MAVFLSALRRCIFGCALALMCALSSPSVSVAQTAGPQLLRVEGVVLDQNGAPIAGAELLFGGESSIITRGVTDGDGRFDLEVAPTMVRGLTVQARGFARFERKWDEIADDAARLEIVLTPAPVLEQVTVTATRTETRLNETAASVVVLSAGEISSTAAVTLDDALRQVPGFSLFRRSGSRTANPTSQGVSLRGVGASGASRAVVLADGIPVNDPFGGWVYWGRIPRESVSRIEVVRGGASHLYGSGALGGAVHLITRRPEATGLSLEASYGNQATPDASLFVDGRRGRWGASLAAEFFRTDGYVLVDERERGPVDTPAGSRRTATQLTLERKIQEQGRLFVRGSLFGEARENGTPLQFNRTHIRQLSAGGDWQIGRVGTFSARAYGGTQGFDQSFTAVSADRQSETLTRLQRVPAQVAGLSIQWSRAFGAKHTLVSGIDAREVRGASDETVFVAGRAASLVGAGGRERDLGLFVEDIIHLTPRLFINAGARFDRWRNYDALAATRPLTAAGPATVNLFPDRAETAFSPHLSVLYQLTDRVSLNASAYRAFRAPTLNELYRSFRVGDVLTLANEQLRAERLSGGEAGAIFNAFDRKLNVRGTLFWMEIARPVANVTLRVAPNLITRQRQNLGRTRSRGLELEGEARITDRWAVSAGYFFADATVVSFPANTSLEGLLIPQVARHQLTFQARYTDPSRLTIGLQGRVSGAQFDDDQNRLRLDPYFTLDALASRRVARGLELFVAAENLFDQSYAIGRTPVRTNGPPLVVRFGLRLHLGSQ